MSDVCLSGSRRSQKVSDVTCVFVRLAKLAGDCGFGAFYAYNYSLHSLKLIR